MLIRPVRLDFNLCHLTPLYKSWLIMILVYVLLVCFLNEFGVLFVVAVAMKLQSNC